VREDSTIRAIYNHANRMVPEECCGIVTASGDVVELENTSPDRCNHFSISALDYIKYAKGALFAYHSHPDRPAVASEADLYWSETARLPLMIVSWPQGDIRMIGDPCSGKALEGRKFIYGVYDCYSLVQDYYRRYFDYELPTVTRPRFGWWQTGEIDPFMKGADRSGMVDGNTPEPGDWLLFQLNGAKVPNHTGVYLGNNEFLHHQLMRVSTTSAYDEFYMNATTRILRRAD